jgi:serine/threonine protein kinase
MNGKPLRLGRFATEALLGQGPTTETYRAHLSDPKGDERRFVITVLRDQAGSVNGLMAARFVEAARQLAGLDQAGCVRVIELGEAPGPVYAVHDFKVGVNLAQLRKQAAPSRGNMDLRLVGLLARKLAERLAGLHARTQAPRAHGGLSPGNVLVTPEGDLLLLDCGLAAAVRPRGDEFVAQLCFAAPEQLAGGVADPASDLYAVGALIHFLLTGQPPFTAVNARALAEKIAAGLPAMAGIPPWLHALMARLLSNDASQRPKTAAEVARQISASMLAAETGQVGPSSPPSTREQVGSSPTRTANTPVPASAPMRAETRPKPEPETPASAKEPIVPFALDDAPTEDERPRVARERTSGKEPVVPFSLDSGSTESADEEDEPNHRLSDISADDPDVGVVYDDDDEEQEQVEVGKDGKRRRRRRRIRIPVWVRSELARRMSRLALIPLIGLILVAIVAGVIFHREWSSTRQESARRNAEIAAEAQKRAQARQMSKPAETPALPAGHMVVKTTPAGATVWVDGLQKSKTPTTITTTPGSHRLVVILPGFRMLRDVVDTSKGVLWEREMFAAPRLDDGRVPVTVTCQSSDKYPVFVDGKDLGQLCPVSDLKLEPGRHSIGLFVIPQNRIWAFDREVQINRPHRVQFNY